MAGAELGKSLRQISKERVGSAAFNLEYERSFTDEELYDDIVSYLGEYRFTIQKYDYELQFSGSSSHDLKLRDSHQGEPMSIKAKRAIAKKKALGEPTHREEAEFEAMEGKDGRGGLEQMLRFANSGDTVLWASPPGPKEEGYGDYGFLYAGTVRKDTPFHTKLSMTAIRLENPTIHQYNLALTALLDKEIAFSHEDMFLAHPFVKSGGIDEKELDYTLKKYFSFQVDESEQKIFKQVVKQVQPAIEDFIQFVKVNPKEDRLQAFYAIENYVIELRNRYKQKREERVVYLDEYREAVPLHMLVGSYGYEPPQVLGSCGSTGGIRSNNIIRHGYQSLTDAIFGEQEKFTCPKCNKTADGEVGNKCPNCGITKEEWAEESGVVCD